MDTTLFNAANRLVREYANKWPLPGNFHEDAVQEAALALWEGRNSYAPTENKDIPYHTSNYARVIAFRAIREMHLRDRFMLAARDPHYGVQEFLEAESEMRQIDNGGNFDVGARSIVLKARNGDQGEDRSVFLTRCDPCDEVSQDEVLMRKQLVEITNRQLRFSAKGEKTQKAMKAVLENKPYTRSGRLMVGKAIKNSRPLKKLALEMEEVKK